MKKLTIRVALFKISPKGHSQSKMTAQKITLSWNEFDVSASSTIRQLWLDQDFTDVTLVTEDERQFKAHKVVLISSSLFFKSLFRGFLHPSPLLFLAGVDSEQLQLLLEFIYLGKCQVAEDHLKLFFATGAKLKISGLLEADNLVEEQDFELEDDKNGAEPESSVKNMFIEENKEDDGLDESGMENERKELDEEGEVFYRPPDNSSQNPHIAEGERRSNNDSTNLKSESKTKIGFCKLHRETFETTSSLMEHKKTFHTDTRHFCDKCDRSYAQESNLALHKESKHEGKRYNCNECNFQSTRKSVLDAHKRFQHKGIGFDCSTCGKKYAQFNGLKLHNMKTHRL